MTPGKSFEQRVRRRFEQAGCYVQKFPSVPLAFIGAKPDGQGGRAPRGGARVTLKNPYDFIVLQPIGSLFHALALETKTTAEKRFDLATVKEHQRGGLRAFPGLAGAVVELRPLGRCFFVPIAEIDGWTVKKSMNLDDLRALRSRGAVIEMPRNTTGREKLAYYDPAPLLRVIRCESGRSQ